MSVCSVGDLVPVTPDLSSSYSFLFSTLVTGAYLLFLDHRQICSCLRVSALIFLLPPVLFPCFSTPLPLFLIHIAHSLISFPLHWSVTLSVRLFLINTSKNFSCIPGVSCTPYFIFSHSLLSLSTYFLIYLIFLPDCSNQKVSSVRWSRIAAGTSVSQ